MVYALMASVAMMQSQPSALPPEQSEKYAEQIELLEGALRGDDYDAIGQELESLNDAVVASATLDWLGAKFREGESSYLSWQYSRLLVGFSEDPRIANLRVTALAAMLYTVAASSIEALQCADRTAWADRAQTFARILAQSGLLALPEKDRRAAAYIALQVEQSNWERRKKLNDAAFLCMNGMAAMSAGIAAGGVSEAEPGPGQFGRQMRVEVPEDFVYERRENEEWWVAAEQRRETLPALIANLANIESIPSRAEMTELVGE